MVRIALIGDRLVAKLPGGRFRVVKRLCLPAAKRRALFAAMKVWDGQTRFERVPAGIPGVMAGEHRFFGLRKLEPGGQPGGEQLELPPWLLKADNPESAPADEREKGESRPKDTDEVSEASDSPSEDAEVHGGDGNSGEVDAPAETSSDEERAGSEPQTSSPDSEQAADGEPQPADLSRAGEEDDPSKSEEDARREALAEQYAPARQARGDEVFRNSPGAAPVKTGVVEPPSAAGKDLKKVLARLFKGWSSEAGEDTGGQMASPRIHGAALVREMTTGRWNMSRVFRQELEERPRTILVAADVSGSCSASSGHTVGICQALTKVWPQLLFVTHANGSVVSVTHNGVTETGWGWGDAPRIADLVEDHRILGVLLFGDADGLSELEPVWRDERCQVIWLDSYCASYGKVFKTSYRRVYGVAEPESGDDPAYYAGVHDSESAAVALRMALRRK